MYKIILGFLFILGVFVTRIILNSFNNPLKNMLSIFDCVVIIFIFGICYFVKKRYFK
ncbi:hypothetical protein CIRMBP1307_02073 [Enterococcus cecorum]|nr:hypothetical protein CIRMBP1307_02073 [Enterococcus cecorum]